MGEVADLLYSSAYSVTQVLCPVRYLSTYSQESVGVAAARNEAAAAATPIQIAAARAQNELTVLKGERDVL